MVFYFIRHGKPDYENNCLTEIGKTQARALAERLKSCGIDKIYSSTSNRAYETAKITADLIGKDVEQLAFADEKHVGKEFGINIGEKRGWCFWDNDVRKAFASPEVKALGDRWYESPAFSGKAFENSDFRGGQERVKKATADFLASLGYVTDERTGNFSAVRHVYDKVALFAHAGFSMIFLSCLMRIPYPDFCLRFEHFGFSCVTTFSFPDEGNGFLPVLINYNDDSHLYKENLIETLDIKIF